MTRSNRTAAGFLIKGVKKMIKHTIKLTLDIAQKGVLKDVLEAAVADYDGTIKQCINDSKPDLADMLREERQVIIDVLGELE